MKKKIFSLFVVFAILSSQVNAAYTVEDIDYSDEIAEIEALMATCVDCLS